MSVYGELDILPEHRTQLALKSKREHTTKVNRPNLTYPNQHIDTTWLKRFCHCVRYHKNYI